MRVAQDARRVIGFFSLLVPSRDAPGEEELDYLFVTDDQQGRGLGRALMADVHASATRLGLRRVHIVSHPPAAPFYQAAGARQVDVLLPIGRVTWSRPVLVLDVAA